MILTARTADDALFREWRHHLQRIPETAFNEHRTSAYVAAVLTKLGFEVVTGIGGTGVVGSLTRGRSGRVVGLRSELDALPITEESGVEYASTNPGTMHACGHDGHIAMLLGAAAVLAEKGGFDGTVRAIFQPAEEPGRGARAMIDDGLLERFPLDSVYGLHNLPGAAAGHLLTRSGHVMASENNFAIHVSGRGGHASAPHLVIDPLVIGAEIIVALQHVVARNVDQSGPPYFPEPTSVRTAPATRSPATSTSPATPAASTLRYRHFSNAASARSAPASRPPMARVPMSPTPTSSRPPSTTPTASAPPHVPRSPLWAPTGSTSKPTPSWPARTSAFSPSTSRLVSRSSATAAGPAKAEPRSTAATTASTTTSSPPASPTTYRSFETVLLDRRHLQRQDRCEKVLDTLPEQPSMLRLRASLASAGSPERISGLSGNREGPQRYSVLHHDRRGESLDAGECTRTDS